MRTLKIALVMLLSMTLATTSFAQSRKGSAKKAESYLKAGELAKAEDEIQAAIETELAKLKKKGKPEVVKSKTLLVEGDIYSALATSSETPADQVDGYITKATTAYNKIKEQEEEKSSVYKDVFVSYGPGENPSYVTGKTCKYDLLYNHFLIAGDSAYKLESYDDALVSLEKAFLVKPQDTLAGKYAFYAATNVVAENPTPESEAKVKEIIGQLKALDYNHPQMYRTLLAIEAKKASDDEDKISELEYDIKDVESSISKLKKDYDKYVERAEYYGKGAGRRYRGSQTKAAENKKNAETAKTDLATQEAKLKELQAEKEAANQRASVVYEKCLEIALEGSKSNPTDTMLSKQVVYYYSKLDKVDEAIASLKAQIKENPSDETLNFNLAVLYDQASEKEREKGNIEKSDEFYKSSEAQYKHLLEINASSKNGLYNLAALYYNRAATYSRELNDLPRTSLGEFKDKAKAAEYEKQIADLCAQSEPYAIKVKDLYPEEPKYWELLARIYTLTKEYDKAEEALNKADELKK